MNEGPYVGPRPFTSAEEGLFFGRETEARELVSLILSHPVVVLCAASGAGKTSLLNAKIVPKLLRRGCEVFSGGRVGGDLPEEISAAQVKNIFAFNTLMTLMRQEPEATLATNQEPRALEQANTAARCLTLTFKNRFARGRKSAKKQIQTSTEQESATNDEGELAPRVLVFDQFEEIFTKYQDRWREREGFFDELETVFENDDNVRVVFAMREEYLASLQPYASILPDQLRTQFRLEGLRRDAALLAIKEPIKNTGRSFGQGAAERLVDNLLRPADPGGDLKGTLEFVEPLHLQIVCSNLWDSLHAGVKEITEGMIQDFGDVDQALRAYYERCVRATVQDKGTVAKINEGRLRFWFTEKLILPGGIRNLVHRDEATTAGMPNSVIDELDLKHHLLRPELRGASQWYELSHDRFIGPIQESNRLWRRRNNATAVEFEEDAAQWEKDERPSSQLLRGAVLRSANTWLKSQGDSASELVGEFIRASLARARATVKFRTAIGAAIMLALIIAFLVLFVQRAKLDADTRAFNAQKLEFDAETTTKQTQARLNETKIAKAEAEVLINYMRGDLTDKLEKLGHLELLDAVIDHILDYYKAYPPEPGDLDGRSENAVTLRQQGDLLSAQGKLKEASERHFAALKEFQQLVAGKPNSLIYLRDLCVSYAKVGEMLYNQGRLDEAFENYKRILDAKDKLRGQSRDPAWQRSLSLAWERVGDVTSSKGDLKGALENYKRSRDIRKELVDKAPGNNDWQRDLSVSNAKVGDVLYDQGNLNEALESFRNYKAIMKNLVNQDPSNAGWQRALSVSYRRISNVLRAQGDLGNALNSYRDSLVICEKLASQDPSNASWRSDLAVNLEDIGNVLRDQGDLEAARKSYRDCFAIREKLASQDPSNAGQQSDLSSSFEEIGNVLRDQGDPAGALKSYGDSLAIREKLAKQDRSNTRWQSSVSSSYEKIGNVLRAQGDREAALKNYKESLAMREKLVKEGPDITGWQLDLSEVYDDIGNVLRDQGDLLGALKNYVDGVVTLQKLSVQDSTNARWQADFGHLYFHRGITWAKVMPTATQEGQPMAEKGREILRDLQKRNALIAEQQKWLTEIEAELGEAKQLR
jgi:tetratricopeptide (TPR) repeat protein